MVVGAVDGDVEVDVAGSDGPQLRQLRLHAVDRLDDVGARLARYRMTSDRRLAVGEPGVAQVLDRVDDLADIATAGPARRCGRR